MKQFSVILKKIRKEKGITQEDIRRAVDLKSREAVSHWENRGVVPDAVTLQKLAKFLGVDVSFLIGESEYETHLDKISAEFGKHRFTQAHSEQYWGPPSDDQINHLLYERDFNEIINAISMKAKEEFSKSKEPALICMVLLKLPEILCETNKYVEDYFQFIENKPGKYDRMVFAETAYNRMFSSVKETILRWGIANAEVQDELVDDVKKRIMEIRE